MTAPEPSERLPRALRAAPLLLAAAVTLGALFLGAPPRFAAGATGPEWLRHFLSALGPLALVEASIAGALALLVASECVRRESPGLPGGRTAARTRLPLVLLFGLGLLQLVPLPGGVLGVVAPFSEKTYAALAAAGDDTMRPMTLWTAGTVHALFNLAGVIAASAAVWALTRRIGARRAASAVLAFVVVLAAAEAAHGLWTTKLGDDLLLGTFGRASGNGRVTGTFIHATMMAVWTGMGACAALGLAVRAFADARRGIALASLAALMLCVVAAALTLSRLGLVAVFGGAAVTACAVIAGRLRGRGFGWAALAAFLAVALLAAAAVAAVVANPAFLQRFGFFVGDDGIADPRFAAWRSTWDLFLRSPVTGTGLGSFGRAIHLTQSVDCPQELWFAHSDPLNLLSDAGLAGAALVVWWIVAAVRRGLPVLRSADAASRALAAGALGGAVVVLVASLGDFQTQFPVVAIPFAALLTLPAAMADAEAASPEIEPRTWLLPPRLLAKAAIAAGLAVAASPVAGAVQRLADFAGPGVTGATAAESLVAQGKALLAKVPSAKDARPLLREAETKLREASRLDPLDDEAHLWTALAALHLGEPPDDVLRALGRVRTVSRGHAQTNLAAGSTYLSLIGTGPAPHGPPGDGALPALREAGALSPQAFSAAWAMCVERRLPVEDLVAVTPDRGHAKIRLADHLRTLGKDDEALNVLTEQLAREPRNSELSTRAASLFAALGRTAEGEALFARLGIGGASPKR